MVAWLLTLILTALALLQYALLRKDLPKGAGPAAPPRLTRLWRREANPLILVALFTNFFADVDILFVTPLLPSADTAALGLCLKLLVLVGFAVQVAHQVVVPDLADARARKDKARSERRCCARFAFPLAITFGAMVIVALWGESLLAIFGPEFAERQAAAADPDGLPARPRSVRAERVAAHGDRRAKAECGARGRRAYRARRRAISCSRRFTACSARRSPWPSPRCSGWWPAPSCSAA